MPRIYVVLQENWPPWGLCGFANGWIWTDSSPKSAVTATQFFWRTIQSMNMWFSQFWQAKSSWLMFPTTRNAKRKPGKWGAVKLPIVTNVDHMVWCTNVLHKSSSQTEFYWKYNHLRGDWYNFFALKKKVCLFSRIHNTASKYTITIV